MGILDGILPYMADYRLGNLQRQERESKEAELRMAQETREKQLKQADARVKIQEDMETRMGKRFTFDQAQADLRQKNLEKGREDKVYQSLLDSENVAGVRARLGKQFTAIGGELGPKPKFVGTDAEKATQNAQWEARKETLITNSPWMSTVTENANDKKKAQAQGKISRIPRSLSYEEAVPMYEAIIAKYGDEVAGVVNDEMKIHKGLKEQEATTKATVLKDDFLNDVNQQKYRILRQKITDAYRGKDDFAEIMAMLNTTQGADVEQMATQAGITLDDSEISSIREGVLRDFKEVHHGNKTNLGILDGMAERWGAGVKSRSKESARKQYNEAYPDAGDEEFEEFYGIIQSGGAYGGGQEPSYGDANQLVPEAPAEPVAPIETGIEELLQNPIPSQPIVEEIEKSQIQKRIDAFRLFNTDGKYDKEIEVLEGQESVRIKDAVTKLNKQLRSYTSFNENGKYDTVIEELEKQLSLLTGKKEDE